MGGFIILPALAYLLSHLHRFWRKLAVLNKNLMQDTQMLGARVNFFGPIYHFQESNKQVFSGWYLLGREQVFHHWMRRWSVEYVIVSTSCTKSSDKVPWRKWLNNYIKTLGKYGGFWPVIIAAKILKETIFVEVFIGFPPRGEICNSVCLLNLNKNKTSVTLRMITFTTTIGVGKFWNTFCLSFYWGILRISYTLDG